MGLGMLFGPPPERPRQRKLQHPYLREYKAAAYAAANPVLVEAFRTLRRARGAIAAERRAWTSLMRCVLRLPPPPD